MRQNRLNLLVHC